MCYLLHSLGCDDGGDGASLLHHHSLLMGRIHGLAMKVAGCGFSVRLHKHKAQSDHTGPADVPNLLRRVKCTRLKELIQMK